MEFYSSQNESYTYMQQDNSLVNSDCFFQAFCFFIPSFLFYTNARENSFPKKISVICYTNFIESKSAIVSQ